MQVTVLFQQFNDGIDHQLAGAMTGRFSTASEMERVQIYSKRGVMT